MQFFSSPEQREGRVRIFFRRESSSQPSPFSASADPTTLKDWKVGQGEGAQNCISRQTPDGNGRISRLVESVILQSSGVKYVPKMLSNFYYKNLDNYYFAFSNSRKNKEHDITAFIEFVVQGYLESLKEIKNKVFHIIKMFTLKDYYRFLRENSKGKISQRQFDLIHLWLNYSDKELSLKDLLNISPFNLIYSKVNERTARRDLEKLSSQKLLLHKNGKYKINLQVLG